MPNNVTVTPVFTPRTWIVVLWSLFIIVCLVDSTIKITTLTKEKSELAAEVNSLNAGIAADSKSLCAQNARINQLQSKLYGIPELELTPDCKMLLGVIPMKKDKK